MKLLALISLAAAVACSCGGGSAARTATSPSGTPSPTAGDIASVVPPGWTIARTWPSADGEYVAVEMAQEASRTSTPAAKGVSVYRRVDAEFVEVARASVPPYAADALAVTTPSGAFDADSAGRRTISISYGNPAPSGETITIDAEGTVTISQAVASGQPTVPPVLETPPPQPLATVESSHRAQDGSPTVTVGAPAGVVPAGWVLTDAVWSSDGRYVAVATAPGGDPFLSHQLSIYAFGNGALRELWREVNGFVRIEDALAFHDINGDGTPDVVYETSTGGNGWTQSATLALTIEADGTAHDVTFKLPDWASAPARAIDMNGDGVYEWAVVDASWELRGFCHACSPGSRTVLAWDGSAYSDASARFGDWIVAQGQEPQVPAGTSCRAQDAYMSQLVSRFLDYTNAHRGSDAARVLDTLSSFAWSPEFTAKRDAIVGALRLDPHHPGDIPDVSCQD